MVAIRRHSVIFTEAHYDLVASLKQDHRLDVSAAIRMMIDFCLDADPTLERIFATTRRSRLMREKARIEAELDQQEETLRELDGKQATEASAEVFPAKPTSAPSAKKPEDLRRASATDREHQTFKDLVPSLLDGTASPRAAAWWRDHARACPDWLSEIAPEDLDRMRGIVLAAGSEENGRESANTPEMKEGMGSTSQEASR